MEPCQIDGDGVHDACRPHRLVDTGLDDGAAEISHRVESLFEEGFPGPSGVICEALDRRRKPTPYADEEAGNEVALRY